MSERWGIGMTAVAKGIKGYKKMNIIQHRKSRYYVNPKIMSFGKNEDRRWKEIEWETHFDTMSINERGVQC